MVIAACQDLRCHSAAFPCEGVLKYRRYGPVEKAIALLLPEPVKRAVAWRVESAVCTPEAGAVIGGRPRLDIQLLLEEPAQLIHCVEAQWRGEFLARRRLERRYVLR